VEAELCVGAPALCSLCRETGEIMRALIKFLFLGQARCRVRGFSAAGQARSVRPHGCAQHPACGTSTPGTRCGCAHGGPVMGRPRSPIAGGCSAWMAPRACSPAGPLPACKTPNAKVAGFWESRSLPGAGLELCVQSLSFGSSC